LAAESSKLLISFEFFWFWLQAYYYGLLCYSQLLQFVKLMNSQFSVPSFSFKQEMLSSMLALEQTLDLEILRITI